MLTHRSPSSSRMLDARVRSWVAPSRLRDTDSPQWFHRILGDRASARSRSPRVPAEARRPRCWPLLVSRRDGRCDPGCGRPKAAPRHPPRLNTVSVLHRHTRPLRTPIIDRDYPGVAFSALRSPAVRDPCAIVRAIRDSDGKQWTIISSLYQDFHQTRAGRRAPRIALSRRKHGFESRWGC